MLVLSICCFDCHDQLHWINTILTDNSENVRKITRGVHFFSGRSFIIFTIPDKATNITCMYIRPRLFDYLTSNIKPIATRLDKEYQIKNN